MNLCELEISARLIFFDEEEYFDYLLSGVSGGSYHYIKVPQLFMLHYFFLDLNGDHIT